MSVWVCTLSIVFRILVNGTYLIFPVIIEHCSISRSFHTLYIKLWHGILTYSMPLSSYFVWLMLSQNIKSQYGTPKLLSHVWVCSHILRIKIIRKSHQMPSNRNFMYIYIFTYKWNCWNFYCLWRPHLHFSSDLLLWNGMVFSEGWALHLIICVWGYVYYGTKMSTLLTLYGCQNQI